MKLKNIALIATFGLSVSLSGFAAAQQGPPVTRPGRQEPPAHNDVLVAQTDGLHLSRGDTVGFVGPLPKSGIYVVHPVSAPNWLGAAFAAPITLGEGNFYLLQMRVKSEDHTAPETHIVAMKITEEGGSITVDMAGGQHAETGGSHGGTMHFAPTLPPDP
jgi:hypothetical protein